MMNNNKDINDATYYIDYCNEHNLMISAGSDCHGEFNSRSIGEPKVSIKHIKIIY